MKPADDLLTLDSIDIHSSVAVYVQIENHIQFAIASGRLKPMDQLPSVRELSDRLKVNPNTVAKAYRDLEVMGYLYTRRGMGVFINKDVTEKCRSEVRERIFERVHQVASEAKASGMPKKDLMEILDESLNLDSTPYGETPPELLALARKADE